MAIARIKKNDTVIVTSGTSAGKTGTVTSVDPKKGTAIVAGVNVHKKAMRRTENTPGGIIDKEMPIDASNVMRVCPKCGKAARVGVKVFDDGSKAKYCKKCGETFNETSKQFLYFHKSSYVNILPRGLSSNGSLTSWLSSIPAAMMASIICTNSLYRGSSERYFPFLHALIVDEFRPRAR